jgi:transcriptional regulator with XRE-family HTH domain
MTIPKDILNTLKQIRRSDHKTQAEISEALGQNSQTIVSRYETEANSPTLRTLCKWVDVLGCEIIIRKKSEYLTQS